MRNAVTLGVHQDSLDLFRRDLKLFSDFVGTEPVVDVVDNSTDRPFWYRATR
jgi:hypothetical protein